ncbi:hypothetical protein [Embleya sp. NBC_00896]|uniref:hypothetical protein n=1 Tax=Embleya sp. NBC_00896 TaxID=2975961 RepID=UPI003863F865|nr:hypothetical protein OG928_32695 [Embleya sp. NBC_00896]
MDDLQHVYVRWRTTDMTWREATYSPKERDADLVGPWDPVQELRVDLRNRAPKGSDPVALGTYPSMHTETAIDRLVVVLNVFYLPWNWFKWAVVALGVGLICVMLGREPTHYRRKFQWVVLSLVSGFGFLAYLWLESPSRRAAADRETTAARLLTDPAALVCLTLAGIFVFWGI